MNAIQARRHLANFLWGAADQTPSLFDEMMSGLPEEPQDDEILPSQRVETKQKRTVREPPRSSSASIDYPPPKELSFKDYFAIFCGDSRLANHWYEKDQQSRRRG